MPELPWWGWVLVAGLWLGGNAAIGLHLTCRGRRPQRGWLASLRRRVADPVDQACADWRDALAPDASHDLFPHMTDVGRRQHTAYCDSLLRDPERSAS